MAKCQIHLLESDSTGIQSLQHIAYLHMQGQDVQYTNSMVMLQLTKQLFEHLWSQWCFDTQQIASGLPQALAHQTPGQSLLLSLERWLILLKVPQPIKSLFTWHASANEALTTPEVPLCSCYSPAYSIHKQQSLLMGLALRTWTHGLQCSEWTSVTHALLVS